MATSLHSALSAPHLQHICPRHSHMPLTQPGTASVPGFPHFPSPSYLVGPFALATCPCTSLCLSSPVSLLLIKDWAVYGPAHLSWPSLAEGLLFLRAILAL